MSDRWQSYYELAAARIFELEAEIKRLLIENANLREERDRLETLLADALVHTPDCYRQPITAILRRKAAEVAGEEK